MGGAPGAKVLTPRHGGQSSVLQSLEGWHLTPQQRSQLRQLHSLLAATRTSCRTERTHASTLDCMHCWVILTPPSFCSRPRTVPASWQALKLIVPAGRNRGNLVNYFCISCHVFYIVFALVSRARPNKPYCKSLSISCTGKKGSGDVWQISVCILVHLTKSQGKNLLLAELYVHYSSWASKTYNTCLLFEMSEVQFDCF